MWLNIASKSEKASCFLVFSGFGVFEAAAFEESVVFLLVLTFELFSDVIKI